MAEERMILDTDPEAATYRTDIKGWVSRDGTFYGDGSSNERTARYAGCTHRACDRCGKPTEKLWLRCKGCRELADRERHEAKPTAKWNGSDYLYSELLDEYFPDLDEAEDRLEDGQTLADLMLVICKPNHVRSLDSEYCCDELPDDGDLPDAVADAMDAFNKAVAGIVLSWSPGKFALKLPEETPAGVALPDLPQPRVLGQETIYSTSSGKSLRPIKGYSAEDMRAYANAATGVPVAPAPQPLEIPCAKCETPADCNILGCADAQMTARGVRVDAPAEALQERCDFLLAACRDAQQIASRYGWALNKIARGDCNAEQVARGALLGTDGVRVVELPEPDCWALLTPNGSKLVPPAEAKGRKDAYRLFSEEQVRELLRAHGVDLPDGGKNV